MLLQQIDLKCGVLKKIAQEQVLEKHPQQLGKELPEIPVVQENLLMSQLSEDEAEGGKIGPRNLRKPSTAAIALEEVKVSGLLSPSC